MRAPNERGTGPGGAPGPPRQPTGRDRPGTAPRTGSGPIRQSLDGSLPPGTMLGKYQIVRQLGQGGMGAVFEAVHTGIGKAVALKTMNPALASDPRSEERFLREAEAASRLEHPHVVGVTDFGSDQGIIYLVMELMRGEDLAGLIARAPAGLDAGFVVDTMLAVCAGVYAAHETGRGPPRPQAPEHLPGPHRPGRDGAQGARFRHLEDGQPQRRPLADQLGLGDGHDPLSLARAGAGRAARRPQRRIRAGRDPLRVPDRPPAPRGRHPLRHHAQHKRGALRAARGRCDPICGPSSRRWCMRAMATRADDRYPSVHALGRALLPLASGKGRVIWADYFSRPLGPPADRSAGSRRMYAPPRAADGVLGPRDPQRRLARLGHPHQRAHAAGAAPLVAGWAWARSRSGLAAAAYMTFGPPRSLMDADKQSTTGARHHRRPGPCTGKAEPSASAADAATAPSRRRIPPGPSPPRRAASAPPLRSRPERRAATLPARAHPEQPSANEARRTGRASRQHDWSRASPDRPAATTGRRCAPAPAPRPRRTSRSEPPPPREPRAQAPCRGHPPGPRPPSRAPAAPPSSTEAGPQRTVAQDATRIRRIPGVDVRVVATHGLAWPLRIATLAATAMALTACACADRRRGARAPSGRPWPPRPGGRPDAAPAPPPLETRTVSAGSRAPPSARCRPGWTTGSTSR